MHRIFKNVGFSLNRVSFFLLPCFLISLHAGCSTVSRPISGTGTLFGFVNLKPRHGVVPGLQGAASYSDRRYRDVEFVDYRYPSFAVVYIDGEPINGEVVNMTLRSFGSVLGFDTPYAVGGVNSEIRVQNADKQPHTLSCPQAGFLKRLREGQEAIIPIKASGEMIVFVLDARGLQATVFAVPGPYSVVSKEGRWELNNLSIGRRTLHAWHPRFPPVSRTIHVLEDEVSRIDLDMGVDSLSEVTTNGVTP